MATEDSSEVVREMTEAAAASNVKVVAEGPAFYSNLAFGNAVANQQAMQAVMQAGVGKIVEMIINTSPSEGGAAVAALQQLMKGAQTTPPVTP